MENYSAYFPNHEAQVDVRFQGYPDGVKTPQSSDLIE